MTKLVLPLLCIWLAAGILFLPNGSTFPDRVATLGFFVIAIGLIIRWRPR